MKIKQSKIRALEPYIKSLGNSPSLLVGVAGPSPEILGKIGFSKGLENGETILPPSSFGPVSRFNAGGKEVIHRDQPKETAYREAEWHWKEWHGRYDQVEQSKIVSVPYKRYPRTLISPPGIELTLTTDTAGNRTVVSPMFADWQSNKEKLLHAVNLFLEIFGECAFFDNDLKLIKAPIKRLNWRILPPGKRPWKILKTELAEVLNEITKGRKVVVESRLETINVFNPDFAAVGEGGFRGYVVLGFPSRNLFVLESLYFGNATYVFGERWEELSKRTKAEILNQSLQTDRIIHHLNWKSRIATLFK